MENFNKKSYKTNINSISTKNIPLIPFLPIKQIIPLQTKIFHWIQGLSSEAKTAIFVIKSQQYLKYINQILDTKNLTGGYCQTQQQKLYYRNTFRYKFKNPEDSKLKQAKKIESQNELLKNIIIFREQRYITFRKEFLLSQKKLFSHISTITDALIFYFQKEVVSLEHNLSCWFNRKDFHHLIEWIVYGFQNQLYQRYKTSVNGQKFAVMQEHLQYQTLKKYLRENVELRKQYFSAQKIEKIYGHKLKKQEMAFCINSIIDKIAEIQDDQIILDKIVYGSINYNQEQQYYTQYFDLLYQITKQNYSRHCTQELQQMIKQTIEPKKKKRKKKKVHHNTKQTQIVENNIHKQQQNEKKQIAKLQNEQIKEIKIQKQSKKTKNQKQDNKVNNIPVINHVQPIFKSQITLINQNQDMINQFNKMKQKLSDFQSEKPIITEQLQQNQKLTYKDQFTKIKKLKKNAYMYLNECLQNFMNNVSENSNKLINYRKIVFNRIQDVISCTLKTPQFQSIQFSVHLFGSCALGLSTDTSDIDIVIRIYGEDLELQILDALEKKLKKCGWVLSTKLLKGATVPIIKLKTNIKEQYVKDSPNFNLRENKLKKDIPYFEVDLSIQNCKDQQNHKGLKSTKFVNEITTTYDSVRKIVLLLKIYLKSRNYHITFKGGLNSYILFLIVYAFFKQRKILESKIIFSDCLDLLHYYGTEFNLKKIHIDLLNQKPLQKSQCEHDRLTIYDPLQNNESMVNTNASLMYDIQQSFLEFKEFLINFSKEHVEESNLKQKKVKKEINTLFQKKLSQYLKI